MAHSKQTTKATAMSHTALCHTSDAVIADIYTQMYRYISTPPDTPSFRCLQPRSHRGIWCLSFLWKMEGMAQLELQSWDQRPPRAHELTQNGLFLQRTPQKLADYMTSEKQLSALYDRPPNFSGFSIPKFSSTQWDELNEQLCEEAELGIQVLHYPLCSKTQALSKSLPTHGASP